MPCHIQPIIQPAHIMTWLLDWLREIVLNTHAFNANGKRKGRETHGIGSWKESSGLYAHDWLGASAFFRARWNSRAKSRAPAPSLSSFLFLPTGTFFLTWTLPSRLRCLIILALTHRTGCAVLSVLSSRCLSPCIESSCGAIAKSSWKWGFFFLVWIWTSFQFGFGFGLVWFPW